MKAKPVKLVYGEGYFECEISEVTHVELKMPCRNNCIGKTIHLPVILKGTRDGTNCWTWNGDTEKPTLRPSVLTTQGDYFISHSWINDGQAQYLSDSNHEFVNQTIDLLNV